jgi:hypothetical protein
MLTGLPVERKYKGTFTLPVFTIEGMVRSIEGHDHASVEREKGWENISRSCKRLDMDNYCSRNQEW